MKRFDFRLARLLRLKEQKKRQAELRLQQLGTLLQSALAEVAAFQERLTETAAGAAQQAGLALPAGAWIARTLYIARLKQALEAVEANVRQIEGEIRSARRQCAEVTSEVEALLFLRKQQWQAHLRSEARAEQAQLDDLGLRRWHAGPGEDRTGKQTRKEVDPS